MNTLATSRIVCAISLILEMDRSFEGMLKISSAPLREAVAHFGQ